MRMSAASERPDQMLTAVEARGQRREPPSHKLDCGRVALLGPALVRVKEVDLCQPLDGDLDGIERGEYPLDRLRPDRWIGREQGVAPFGDAEDDRTRFEQPEVPVLDRRN